MAPRLAGATGRSPYWRANGPRHRRAAQQAEDISASHGAPPEFEERRGYVRARWRSERRRASTAQGAHGPIGSSCDRDVERFCFVCTVGRSSGKPVSLMGVLRSGTGRLQSGSAGLDLRKATCGPVPTRIISRTRLLTRAISPDLPADGEPDDEPYSNEGQNDRYERTSTPCRTPTYARVGAPSARR
jgi:hypothetical protein